ncbi:MAG TPA: aminotransferase class V-fold PLP-dependent enzyme [Chloroflexota bacterium]|nr:aminotransferase class V-fold PLP-dependent enzyme [Chloroflexota bacterium]
MSRSFGLQLVPGPVPVPAEVLAAREVDYPSADLEPEFFALYETVQGQLQRIMGTAHSPVIMLGEAMVVLWGAMRSCVAPGDRVLAVSTGLFGEGFAEMARGLGADVRLLAFGDDEAADPDRVEAEVQAFRPRLVTAVHCETPSGVLNPVAEIGARLERHGVELYLVDAVASIGGAPLDTDAARIDLCLLGTQKCLAAPPDLGIVAVSPRAWEAVARVGYQGYDALAPFADAVAQRLFPYTHSWHALAGLQVACRLLLEEGLEAAYERHRRAAALCRRRGRERGLDLFPRQEAAASPTVTTFRVPPALGWPELDRRLRRRGLVVGGNYGRLAGQTFRIGHMGTQADEGLVARAMELVAEALQEGP